MDFKKLGNLLAVIGALLLAGAVLWWFSFYSSLLRELGRATGGNASMFDALHCLYGSDGACALVSGISSLAGRTPYEPMLFWFALAALLLGAVIRVTAKASPGTGAKADKDTL